jgi:hypothetical protein
MPDNDDLARLASMFETEPFENIARAEEKIRQGIAEATEEIDPNPKDYRFDKSSDSFVSNAEPWIFGMFYRGVDGYLNTAREAVLMYLQRELGHEFTTELIEGVYIVWFSKTLQNWKALLSTSLPDSRYYEVTYNGDENEVYLDVYVKEFNVRILDV